MEKSKKQSAVGIIAEYNPFHNGHAYQIQRAKELTGSKYCIVVMSGDFVQRGAPAIYDKYLRTDMALNSGADLVLEIPAVFASGNAEDFASCGVALLDRIGVVDSICFGSECGTIVPLLQIAEVLVKEPPAYTAQLKEGLSQGLTFPKSRDLAFAEYRKLNPNGDLEYPDQILTSPNNILGIEYCKALMRRHSPITPVTLLRTGSSYHGTELSGEFASASAIRQAIANQALETVEGQVSPPVFEGILRATPVFLDDFSQLLNYRLLETEHAHQNLTDYLDVSEELAARIQNLNLHFDSFEHRIQALKSRQYTYTRVERALLHLLLGITVEEWTKAKNRDYVSYARILGFRRDSVQLLHWIKEASSLPLITKTADAPTQLSPEGLQMLERDMFCSHLYQSMVQSKSGIVSKNEFTRSLVLR
ncbi:MAG: nucleotidyltransferase [Hungatella sp.]